MKKYFFFILAFTLLVTPKPAAWAVVTFQDLNFESATVAAAPANYTPQDAADPISALAALPGWTVYEDTTQCTAVWGEPVALDETSVALYHNTTDFPVTPIDGTYSVELTSFVFATPYPGYYSTSSISQTGLVPAATRSIRFSIEGAYGTGPLVTLGGNQLALKILSTSNGITTMAADIGALGGQTETLMFAAKGGTTYASESGFVLDDIQFSPLTVPEPGSSALMALGTVGLTAGVVLSRRSRLIPRSPATSPKWTGLPALLCRR